MPIPLGILAAAGFRPPAAAGAFELLETALVGAGGQAAVEFTNLTSKYASTYQHLQVRMLTANNVSSGDSTQLRVNGDSGSNYAWHYLVGVGNGGVPLSAGQANTSFVFANREGSGSSLFGAGVLDILDPFEGTKNATFRSLTGAFNASERAIFLFSGSWRNNNSITTLRFFSSTGTNLLQGSRFSLYGIRSVA